MRNREYVIPARLRDGVDKAPPHFYFVFSAVFHYLGPAFAVLLFARVDVLGVAWLRIASAAAIFAVWRRPWNQSACRCSPTRSWSRSTPSGAARAHRAWD